jgi:hypothetical protein
MPSGEYTAASAYDIQFLGAYLEFRASSIWRALSTPKYRFFAWLAQLRKAPTANNLALKGWPCNPSCALCYYETEMIDHVLTECNFAKAVWDRVAQEFQVHVVLIPFQKGEDFRLDSCLNQNLIQAPAENQCRDCLVLLVAPVEGAELKNF